MISLTDSFGVIISADDVASVNLADQLDFSGAVMIRGVAGVDVVEEILEPLAKQRGETRVIHWMGAPHMRDHLRYRPVFTDENGSRQRVEPGNQDIFCHQENGRVLWCPTTVSFYCNKPAQQGGETRLCDGVAVWKHLKEETRQLFRERGLSFGVLKIALDVAERRVNPAAIRSETFFDQSGVLRFRTPAIYPTRDGCWAFCNSVLGPYDDLELPCWGDGSLIDGKVITELKNIYTLLEHDVRLEIGDLLTLDNRRIMHGRRGFSGEREMYIYLATSARVPASLIA